MRSKATLRFGGFLAAFALSIGCTESGSGLLPGDGDGDGSEQDNGADGGPGNGQQDKLRGRVFDRFGQPAPNALIYSLGGPGGVVGAFEALTDSDGFFDLETSATRLLARLRFDQAQIVTLSTAMAEPQIFLVPTETLPETLALGNVGMEMRFATDATGVYDFRIVDDHLHLLRVLDNERLVWTKENLVTREIRTLQEFDSLPDGGGTFLDVASGVLALPLTYERLTRVYVYSSVTDEVAGSSPRANLDEFLGATQDGLQIQLNFSRASGPNEPISISRLLFHPDTGFTASEVVGPVAASHCRSELHGTVVYFDTRNPDGFYEYDTTGTNFRMRQHIPHPDHRCMQWVDGTGPHGVVFEESSITVVHELEGRLQTLRRSPGPVGDLADIEIQDLGADVLVTSNFARPGPFFEFNTVTGAVLELRDVLQPILFFRAFSSAAKNDRDETFVLAQTTNGPERVFWDRAGGVRREAIIGNFDRSTCVPIDLVHRDPRDNVDMVLCNMGGVTAIAFETTGLRRSFFHVAMPRLGKTGRNRIGDWVARYSIENRQARVNVFDLKAPR